MITQYNFFRTKYGEELLIDLIRLEDLNKYIKSSPVQRLSYYDITVITDGNGTFTIDDHEQELKRGNIFFSSPGQIRKWNTNHTPKGFVLIFEDEFLSTFFNDTQFTKHLSCFNLHDSPPVLELTASEFLKLIELFQNIKIEILSFKKNDKHILRALLYQTLIFLNRKFIAVHPESNKNAENRYMHRFIQLVETDCSQNRNVDYYAQQLYITSGHLNSLVKKHYGISAKKYILNKMILEAKRLLQYTEMSIDQIANRLHYENANYFAKTFKQHTGFTPLNFRKQKNP
ncbi:MAG: AraC family transcriptional regulator [Flavobacteriaceae bacterium]|jgi:AraC-like DNA-binding protein|nr:AraC family transcriptional regulator [Flavobacteriaceae bacterium]